MTKRVGINFFLPVLLISFLFSYGVHSQIVSSYKKIAVSKIQQRAQTPHSIISLSRGDLRKMVSEDSIEEKGGFPFRFGKSFAVDIDVMKNATVFQNGDTTVYIYEIKCPSAFSVNLIFDQFALNDQSVLRIFNNDGDFTYGPVTSSNNPVNKVFWTDLIKGDHIIIELREANTGKQLPNLLHISSVIYGYKNTFKTPELYGESLPCNNDIACPEGDDWRVEANAVAMVLLASGTRWCSGSLVNNTQTSVYRAYFLTAFHCLDYPIDDCTLSTTEKDAVYNWLFRFFYQSPTCGGPDGTEYVTINGSYFRAGYQPTDFTLLELHSMPALSTYAGWSRATTAAIRGVGIHHPSGDVKKISIENNPLVASPAISWVGGCTTPTNTHWTVTYDDGTTEGGSSGSPMINPDHKIVGQLHGGDAGCPPVNKYYGRFDKSWTGGGTDATRLRNWLDPGNTGVTTLNTKYNINSTISGQFSVCSNTPFSVSNVPVNCTVVWENGPNITRVSAQGSNPCYFSAAGTGSSWIRASIKSVPFNGYITLPQYRVYAGIIQGHGVSGPSAVCPGNVYNYTATMPGGHSSTYSYSWTYPSGWSVMSQSQNNISLYLPSNNNQYGTVRVAITNGCGTSSYSGITVYPAGCGGYFSMFPNPSSNEVTIEIGESSPLNAATDSNRNVGNSNYIIRIYNNQGTRVKEVTRAGQSFKIPLNNLQDGNYIVEISDGKAAYREQLLIKRE